MTGTKRSFKAKAIRESTESAIAIVEYDAEGETLAIYSIYYPTRLSNKETFDAVMQSIKTNPGDSVTVRASDIRVKREWRCHYDAYFKLERGKTRAFDEVTDLARDAIKRKSTILENLNEWSDETCREEAETSKIDYQDEEVRQKQA